jgi:hypothetical protein
MTVPAPSRLNHSYCSPSVNVKDHFTCFEYDELKEIADAFNKYIQKNRECPRQKRKDKKTCGNLRLIDTKQNKSGLWKSIYKRLKYVCPYEYCWVDLDFINEIDDESLREKIQYFTFKPKMTRTQNSWLSTQDINNVLQQYQEIFPSFKFLGALPSDFYKVTQVDYTQTFNYNRIGMVFNLDTHNQPGSHWVAFLIDNRSKTLEYYDSAGKLPNKNIQGFIDLVSDYIKSNGINYKICYNSTKHQFQNNECGVYAIYFLVQRLLGFDFDYITKNVIKDKQMNRFRKVLFRPRK